jgi:ABC-type bacteriocin/lantibiotic exporter with double-glycine peptidase domain
MQINEKVFSRIGDILKEDKRNIFYLLYYSVIEGFLVLVLPLTTSFIINSTLAHATLSVFVLSFVVIVIFILTTFLQIIKEYIIEKFQQKVFLRTSISIAQMAAKLKNSSHDTKHMIDKYMNYFFDVSAIQKFFPVLLLEGTGLVVKIVMSLLLLLAFEPLLFGLGVVFFIIFISFMLILGRNGAASAIERSDAKHNAIYYLQNIPNDANTDEYTYKKLDSYLIKYIDARTKIFKIIIRQVSLTFIIEGLIFSSFLILGAHLVVSGTLPIGEFIAAEIVVVSITYALKSFVKQIDYIYDMIEGFYKIDKLSVSLKEHQDA